MRNNNLGRLLYQITAAIICCSLFCSFMCSCSNNYDTFPELSFESLTSDEEVQSDVTIPSDSEIYSITVALPYSYETVDYLVKLYYVKTNDLMPDDENGMNIDLDYLNSFSVPYVVNSINVAGTGAQLSTLEAWGDDIPDVFLAGDLSGLITNEKCISLNNFLSESEYITGSNMFSVCLEQMYVDGLIYGIPHYCTQKLIFGDSEFLSEESEVSFVMNIDDFRLYTEDMISHIDYESDFVAFSNAYLLTPYLNNAFYGSTDRVLSFMGYEDYPETESMNSVFDSVDFVEDMYERNLTNSISNGTDYVIGRNCGMWLDDSSQVLNWATYYPNSLFITSIPQPVIEDRADSFIPYVSCYPLCVSADTEYPEFSSDFATFISLDSDAQLLIYRLEEMTGYYPVIKHTTLWDHICSNSYTGFSASLLESNMNSAVFVPDTCSNNMYNNINSYLYTYFSTYSENDTNEFSLVSCYGS